jgi:transcriptional regulator with XRE-family HTH domain
MAAVLTLKQVSERIGLSPRSIRQYRCNGQTDRIPRFIKQDGKLIIFEHDLDEWLTKRYRRLE